MRWYGRRALNLDHNTEIPKDIIDLDQFSPFAIEFRYDILPTDPKIPFDRKSASQLLKKVRLWAEQIIKP